MFVMTYCNYVLWLHFATTFWDEFFLWWLTVTTFCDDLLWRHFMMIYNDHISWKHFVMTSGDNILWRIFVTRKCCQTFWWILDIFLLRLTHNDFCDNLTTFCDFSWLRFLCILTVTTYCDNSPLQLFETNIWTSFIITFWQLTAGITCDNLL